MQFIAMILFLLYRDEEEGVIMYFKRNNEIGCQVEKNGQYIEPLN